MADKKLNEVTKVTDMAYVPVIMADGSIGQIAKADLASVVAELNGDGIKFKDLTSKTIDINNLTTHSTYLIYNTCPNTPTGMGSFGWLMSILSYSTAYIMQLLIDNQGILYYRAKNSSTWLSWRKVTAVSV